jgi:PPK2 family polyphosphate:nucleotide phosphotransferase
MVDHGADTHRVTHGSPHMPDLDRDRIRDLARALRVEPGARVRLPRGFDPDDTRGIREEEADDLLAQGIELLSDYQARLAAQDTQALLVIIQAIDAAGKDGTIRHVMSGVNPQGVQVTSFKVPSAEEADHDFLWRCSKALPPRGMIGIFNRSYYEETLVVRVHPAILDGQPLPHEKKGKDIWARRFRHINDWEAYLVDQGTTIVKLFLNLSKDEQRRRFIARIDEPDKNWKFSAGDVKERAYWDDYQRAYSDMLTRSSTAAAPWHVIPADHKWFARIAAAAIIGNALVEMDPRYPVLDEAARAELLEARAQLVAEDAPAASPDEGRADDASSESAAASPSARAGKGGKGSRGGKGGGDRGGKSGRGAKRPRST